ncbi:acyl carrier protein [Parafrigoribacterium humi]|uniref:acyl carrier protein n=1 Tax=Parafrigoribacterium humi TaxID=3144664 RepID=UPI0032EEC725
MEKEEFISFVAEILEVDASTLALSDRLEDIDWDSLANITFIAEVDTRFGVTLDADRLGQGQVVSDLYKLFADSVAVA